MRIYFEELIKTASTIKPPIQKVLAIGGSPRKNGNTDLLINQITAGVKNEHLDFENVNLGDIELNGCIGCEKCRKDKVCTKINDGMSTLYPDILTSQGLILASPVHNYNITSWMKAFIDRLYCFYEFDNNSRPRSWSSRLANQNRKVVIAAIGEQDTISDLGFAIEAMQRPMEALGFEVVGSLPVLRAFEKGAIKKQPDTMEQAYDLGVKLAQSLQ
ncbi:flavodoxin family protein [Geofilum sp. OHC36d9]|uniref:flavodoxin family protein n=1 Tax=Geofilum sp. OHC36d9 TaxID=3458413 RepID=UPI00403375AB